MFWLRLMPATFQRLTPVVVLCALLATRTTQAQVPLPPSSENIPPSNSRATGDFRTATGGRMTVLQPHRIAQRTDEFGQFRSEMAVRLAQQSPRGPATVPSIRSGQGSPASPPTTREPSRLRNLPGVPGLSDPEPNSEIDREYSQFINRTVDPQKTLDMIVDRPRILVFKETPTRLYIAQDSIASYEVISDTEIAIVGVSEGRTVLTIWVADDKALNGERVLSYLVRVAEDPEYKQKLESVYAALEEEINKNFPDSMVKLALIGDQLIVRGQAKDVVEASQIIRICEEHAPPSRDDQDENRVSSISRSVFSPFGTTTRTDDFGETGISIDNLAEAGIEGDSNVINMLKIPGEQQVMLRIIVAEVNRSAIRQIGTNLAINSGSVQFLSAFPAFDLISNVVTAQEGGGAFAISRGDFGITLSALRQMNLARTLAEPTLVALNGRSASFQAGGQFAVPSATSTFGSTAQGVQFIPLGVQLNFTPYILDRDKVRLVVNSTVRSIDENLSTQVGGGGGAGGGTNVRGLQNRTFSTTVELREGETLGVAGLIQSTLRTNGSRVPMFGDIPYVGRAFGRDTTSSDEQELLILISPEFQHPVDDTAGLTVPGADTYEPGDAEFFLKGQLESRRSNDFRSQVRTDFDKQMRYHYADDLYLVGPFGYSFGGKQRGPLLPSPAPTIVMTPKYEEPEPSVAGRPPAPLPLAPAPSNPSLPRRVPASKE